MNNKFYFVYESGVFSFVQSQQKQLKLLVFMCSV